MIKIKVSCDGKTGMVSYDEDTKKIQVHFPDENIRKKIIDYLNTKRVFKIPESNRIDDYREDFVYPNENSMYFDLAMNTLWANTGVFVEWGEEPDDPETW